MSSFESAPMPEQSMEQEPWNRENALVKESGILEKFRGNAKKVARVMLFVSALSAGAVGVKEAYAGEMNSTATNEQTQKSLPRGNKSMIIQFLHEDKETGPLFQSIHKFMELARNNIKDLKTPKDAAGFFVFYFDKILSFYPVEKADVKQEGDEIRRQLGTADEMKFLLQTAREMKSMTLDIYEKFGQEEISHSATHSMMTADERLVAMDRIINELQWVEKM